MGKEKVDFKKDPRIEDPDHPGHWISRAALRKRRNRIGAGPLINCMQPAQVVFKQPAQAAA